MLLSYSAFHKFVGIVFGMEYSFSTPQVNFLFCTNACALSDFRCFSYRFGFEFNGGIVQLA